MNGAQQSWLVVRDEDANGQRAQDVEEQNAPEHTAHSLGDVTSRVLSLTSGHGNHLYTTVREGGVDQGREQSEEPTCVAKSNIFFHRTWMLPVSEPEPVTGWPSAKIDDESKDDQSHDCDDLDTRETKFGFSINSHCEDIQANHQNDDERYPSGNVDVHRTIPELYDDRRGRDFRAKSDGTLIPVLSPNKLASMLPDLASTYIPTDRKTHGVIYVTCTKLRYCTRQW